MVKIMGPFSEQGLSRTLILLLLVSLVVVVVASAFLINWPFMEDDSSDNTGFRAKVLDDNSSHSWRWLVVDLEAKPAEQKNELVFTSTLRINELPPKNISLYDLAPEVEYYDENGNLIGSYLRAPGEIGPLGGMGKRVSKFSLQFVRSGKFVIKAVYEFGGSIDVTLADSVKVEVNGPSESFKNIEKGIEGYPVNVAEVDPKNPKKVGFGEAKSKSSLKRVIVGSLPETQEEREDYGIAMGSMDVPFLDWFRSMGSVDDNYYEIRMQVLTPKIVGKSFRAIQENLSGLGREVPKAFVGNPKTPAIYRHLEDTLEPKVNVDLNLYESDENLTFEIFNKGFTEVRYGFYGTVPPYQIQYKEDGKWTEADWLGVDGESFVPKTLDFREAENYSINLSGAREGRYRVLIENVSSVRYETTTDLTAEFEIR